MELNELEQFVSKMEKRIRVLESDNGKMKELINSIQAELFLPEVNVLDANKVMRKRVTMMGVLNQLINVVNGKPKAKIFTAN